MLRVVLLLYMEGEALHSWPSPVLVTSPPQANEPQNSLDLNTSAPPPGVEARPRNTRNVPRMPRSRQRGFSSRPSRLAGFSSASRVEEG